MKSLWSTRQIFKRNTRNLKRLWISTTKSFRSTTVVINKFVCWKRKFPKQHSVWMLSTDAPRQIILMRLQGGCAPSFRVHKIRTQQPSPVLLKRSRSEVIVLVFWLRWTFPFFTKTSEYSEPKFPKLSSLFLLHHCSHTSLYFLVSCRPSTPFERFSGAEIFKSVLTLDPNRDFFTLRIYISFIAIHKKCQCIISIVSHVIGSFFIENSYIAEIWTFNNDNFDFLDEVQIRKKKCNILGSIM